MMQRLILFIFLLTLISCHSSKKSKRLYIDKNNISSVWITCKNEPYALIVQDRLYEINEKEGLKIVNGINRSSSRGILDSTIRAKYWNKDITEKVTIVLKSLDTIHVRFLRGMFIWKDSTYQTDLGIGGYLNTKLCIMCAENELSLDSLWNLVAFNEHRFGCLVGGQYVERGIFGGEGCELTSSPFWKGFFDRPKDELTTFLVDKFEETKETVIHTCPFKNASEGELAVYCLHKIYLKNWDDFEYFREYKEVEPTFENNSQVLIRRVLKDEKSREVLKSLWLREMNKQ